MLGGFVLGACTGISIPVKYAYSRPTRWHDDNISQLTRSCFEGTDYELGWL